MSDYSMGREYKDESMFESAAAIEWAEEQDRLKACVTPEMQAQLKILAHMKGGGVTYWCKHGIARAYFADGTFAALKESWDWSKFNGNG